MQHDSISSDPYNPIGYRTCTGPTVKYNPADTIGDFERDFPNLTGYCKNFHISEHSRCIVVGFLSNTVNTIYEKCSIVSLVPKGYLRVSWSK